MYTENSLVKSGVVFTDNPHGYHLPVEGGSIELKGITGILHEHLFPDMYYSISDDVLVKAAARGTVIHENCRAYDLLGVEASDEAVHYAKMMSEGNFQAFAHEYTVSDEKYVASNIDVVAEKDGDIVLMDIKTTSRLNDEYLSWQLSIYKYLFKLQNPDLDVKGLYGIWLPQERYGKPKIIKVAEVPIAEVKKLLECDAKGEKYSPIVGTKITTDIVAMQQTITSVFRELKETEKKKKSIMDALYTIMEANDIKKWECDDFSVSRVLPTSKTSFDSAKFRKDHADLYEQYQKTSKVAGTVRITLKNE